MGLFSSRERKKSIDWEKLTAPEQLEVWIEKSAEKHVMLFKHSTRCSISFMAKKRLESSWDEVNEQIIPVYLDLLAHRSISNQIAEEFNVIHESPQVILLKDGKCVYHASHSNISVDALKKEL